MTPILNNKINIGYFYIRKSKELGFNDYLATVFLIGISFIIVFGILDAQIWSIKFILSIGGLFVTLFFCSLFFPIGWTSIYLDDQTLRFVPHKVILNIIMPLRSTYLLNKETIIQYIPERKVIYFTQNGQREYIYILGINGKAKEEIPRMIYEIVNTNKNVTFIIEQKEQLFNKKLFSISPRKYTAVELKLQSDDILFGDVDPDSEDPFGIWLYNEENFKNYKEEKKAKGLGKGSVREYYIYWTIKKTGIYYFVIDNRNGKNKLPIYISLEREHNSKDYGNDFKPVVKVNNGWIKL